MDSLLMSSSDAAITAERLKIAGLYCMSGGESSHDFGKRGSVVLATGPPPLSLLFK